MAVGPVQHQALPKICKYFSAYFEFHAVSFTTVVLLLSMALSSCSVS